MPQSPDSPLVQLAKALEAFPSYLANYAIGLVVIVLTDVLMTSLFFGCVLLALITSPLIAGAVLMLSYTAIRSLNAVANAIGVAGQHIAAASRPLFPPVDPYATIQAPPASNE